MKCTNPITIPIPVSRDCQSCRDPLKGRRKVITPRATQLEITNIPIMTVPCGKCLACRIHHRREWSIRGTHELYSFDNKAIFITLTYSPEHLPANASLVQEHLINFIHDLRKRLDPDRIKYLACGEYGDKRNRPHYHAILYGLQNTPETRDLIKSIWKYCDWNTQSDRKTFKQAHVKNIEYICGYIDKKYGGNLKDEIYTTTGRIVPFRRVSQGFGLRYLIQHYANIVRAGHINFNGSKCSIPRYYCKKLKELYNIDITLVHNTPADYEAQHVADTLLLDTPTLIRDLPRCDALRYIAICAQNKAARERRLTEYLSRRGQFANRASPF